jgi:hypothetical protein
MRLLLVFAQTLSAPDLRDQEISALVARKLREFHELDMPGPKDVSLWQRLRCVFFLVIRSYATAANVRDSDQRLIAPCCVNQAVASGSSWQVLG